MKIAVLSDIHGNFEALDAVIKSFSDDIEQVWSLGDVIGYGPEPRRCLQYVEEFCKHTLIGNHEDMVMHPDQDGKWRDDVREETQWTRKQLTDHDLIVLESWPEMVTTDKDITLVHAGFPDHIWSYTQTTVDALRIFGYLTDEEGWTDNICFLGHTHRPTLYELMPDERITRYSASGSIHSSNPMIVNVGSVGQPRDGSPLASYVIYHTDTNTIEFKRVKYNVKETQKKMREVGLPSVHSKRLETGT